MGHTNSSTDATGQTVNCNQICPGYTKYPLHPLTGLLPLFELEVSLILEADNTSFLALGSYPIAELQKFQPKGHKHY